MGGSLDDAFGMILGRYTLHGEIASGGMATVHLGRMAGTAGFSKVVAIKRLHAQFAKDPEFVKMFLDEARLASRIRHPNVVQVQDIIHTEGEVFIVLDYIRGESLSKIMRSMRPRGERMSLKIAGASIVGALHGLHAAHEATNERGEPLGIVHRDVSPQNILVGTDGVARVLDFGIAKAANRFHHTRSGDLKGKLAYMAPEQLTGETPVDRRTDIYAAAIVLWEMLTGRRLFQSDYQSAILARAQQTEIDPPSKYAEVPSGVDDLVLRGLARDPDDRFSTAREMAIALERTMPLATPSRVGEWIEDVAREILVARDERVAEIERAAPERDPEAGAQQILAAMERQSSDEQPAQRRQETRSWRSEQSAPRSMGRHNSEIDEMEHLPTGELQSVVSESPLERARSAEAHASGAAPLPPPRPAPQRPSLPTPRLPPGGFRSPSGAPPAAAAIPFARDENGLLDFSGERATHGDPDPFGTEPTAAISVDPPDSDRSGARISRERLGSSPGPVSPVPVHRPSAPTLAADPVGNAEQEPTIVPAARFAASRPPPPAYVQPPPAGAPAYDEVSDGAVAMDPLAAELVGPQTPVVQSQAVKPKRVSWLWIVVLLFVALSFAYLFAIPKAVEKQMIDAAAARGFVLTAKHTFVRHTRDRGLFTVVQLEGVEIRPENVSDVTLQAEQLAFIKREDGTIDISARGAELMIDGSIESVADRMRRWMLAYPIEAKKGDPAAGEYADLTIESGRVHWSGVLGDGTKLTFDNIHVELPRQTDASIGEHVHVATSAATMSTPAGNFGPWSLDLLRSPESLSAAVGLSPPEDRPVATYISRADGFLQVRVDIPKSKTDNIGIPRTLIGLQPDESLEIAMDAKLVRSSAKKATAELTASAYGLHLTGGREPIDVHVHCGASGDPKKELELKDGVALFGSLRARVWGKAQLLPDGFVLDTTWRSAPKSCKSIAARDTSISIQSLAKAASRLERDAKREARGGETVASGAVTLDTRNLGRTRVTTSVSSTCGSPIFESAP